MKILLAFLVLTSSLAAQQTGVPFGHSEIRRVLLLARESALQEERDEEGSTGGSLPQRLQLLMIGFRSIDDLQDAASLQKGVNKDHKGDVLIAPLHAQASDYKKLRSEALQLSTDYDRGTAMSRLVKQEIDDGFVDDAIQSIPSIPDADTRAEVFSDVGAFLWKQGKQDDAKTAFEKAINSALEIKNEDPARARQRQAVQLGNTARVRYEAGDVDGALSIFSMMEATAVKEAMEVNAYDFCSSSISTQAQLGLLQRLQNATGCPATPVERAFIEGEIAKQQLIHSDPTKALPPEIERDDVADKIDILADVAKSRADAQDQAGAMIVLDRAWALGKTLTAAPAWVAHRLHRIAMLYLDLGAQDKAMLVVEKIRSLKEATESPRERYDFLFDLAVGYGALGRFDEAHSYVKEMAESPNEQACNLVGYQETEQGQADDAVSWAKGIKDSTARTSALAGIVEAMLDANQAAADKEKDR
jgi:tetratricopeptide (TPR) repeat protein